MKEMEEEKGNVVPGRRLKFARVSEQQWIKGVSRETRQRAGACEVLIREATTRCSAKLAGIASNWISPAGNCGYVLSPRAFLSPL